jgi:hypothetical protein
MCVARESSAHFFMPISVLLLCRASDDARKAFPTPKVTHPDDISKYFSLIGVNELHFVFLT